MQQDKQNKKTQSNLGRAALPPFTQRKDSSAACVTIAVQTADEFNHSAVGTLHPHHSDTFFLYVRPILRCPIPSSKNSPFQLGSHPTVKKSSIGPPDPSPQTTKSAFIHRTSILLALVIYDKLDELAVPVSQYDQRCTHNTQTATRQISSQTSQSSPNRAKSAQ